MKTKILLLISFTLFIFIILFVNLYQHENIHKAIAYNHQCNESKISYSFYGGEFECTNYKNRTTETILQELNLHSLNEIVGYNTYTILLTLVICTLMICVILYTKK